MSDFINTIDQLGDEVVFDSILDKSITEFKDDVLTIIGKRAFQECANLTTIDLPNVEIIDERAFSQCKGIKKVILRSNKLCVLKHTNGFYDTYLEYSWIKGYIYVPRALLSDTDATMDYRQATNWTTYASKFRALEDYTVDGTIMGELDPTKI